MRVIGSVAAALSALALAACEQGANGANLPSPLDRLAAVAPSFSDAPTPFNAYRIARVTPSIEAGADLGWFENGEGSPREVGAFVGASVIQGLEGLFTGERPINVEVAIRQFRPAPAEGGDEAHRVKVDLTFIDVETGERIAVADGLLMDLLALRGTAAMIARNAGRSPEVRLAERIARITAAWSRDLNCDIVLCPAPTAVAETEPAPEPIEVVTALQTPEPEAAAPAAPVEDPAPAAAAPTEAAPGAAPAAEENLFARIFAPKDDAAAEPEAVAEAPEAATPAPDAQGETAAATPPQDEAASEGAEGDDGETPPNPIGQLFAGIFGAPDEIVEAPEEEAEAEKRRIATTRDGASTPTPIQTPRRTPTRTPGPAPAIETEEEVAAAPVESAAAVEPEPAAEPAPVARAETPTPQPASPEASDEVAAAPPATTSQPIIKAPTQSAQPAPPRETAQAGSPFFRSPASTVPTLPQTALLGRSQRNNDPLRRRTGDVVLEVANLPAFWDGDETTGGVWVALPYVPAYRRAIVTNPQTGQTVEANLFWRDPQAGGGSTLLSSAAAAALGVTPGEVTNLGVKIVAAD